MKKNKLDPRKPADNDFLISENLVKQRKERNLTQEFIAKELNISTQQYQKYENTNNRITAGRLLQLANFYNICISEFYK
jgi:transcriptional regulator with XRE-family HTH domain